MSTPVPSRSFLVTHCGAHAGSGVGTGGLTVVHEGKAAIVDKVESTGLTRDGDTIFRFARALNSIVGYGVNGVRYVAKVPEAKGAHDLLWTGDGFIVVATGANTILWTDAFGRVKKSWQADGSDDAWHLNCLFHEDGRLYCSAFGRFPTHRSWVGKCHKTGFVLDVESGTEVMNGLSGPHNPRRIDGRWVVCDSHVSALLVEEPGAPEPRRIPMGGFTRGFAHDEHFFYVGESANRKAETPSTTSHIAVVDRRTLEVVQRIPLPFPEIYELLVLSPAEAQRFAENPDQFQIDASSDRTHGLEMQIEEMAAESAKLRQRVENMRHFETAWGRVVHVKRRLLGS